MALSALKYPIVNGVRHSFASVELVVNGDIYLGVHAINYDRTRTRGWIRGPNPDPIGKTRGENAYKADIELFLAEFNVLINKLGAGYGDVPFVVKVTYTENGLDTIQDILTGCTIDSTNVAETQGTNGSMRKFDLNPVKIYFNGLDDNGTPFGS